LDQYVTVAKELLEGNDPLLVIAAALKLMTKEPDNTPVHITEERPLPMKKDFQRSSKKDSQKSSYRRGKQSSSSYGNKNRKPKRAERRP